MKKYYGLFEKIKNDYPDSINECPLYYKEAADFYDQISLAYNQYDEYFFKQAKLHGGPILELCSGSGRITMSLAKLGFDITAVDLSDDMLANLRYQLEKKRKRVKGTIKLLQADMLQLELKEKYNLIIIGATSIRLMEDDFTKFFNSMYRYLNVGGCFFFDFENLPRKSCDLEEEPISVCDLKEEDQGLSILCLQRIINYKEMKANVNFIKIKQGKDEKVLLSQTQYRIFGIEEIRKAAEHSAFGSCEIIQTIDNNNYFCKMIKK